MNTFDCEDHGHLNKSRGTRIVEFWAPDNKLEPWTLGVKVLWDTGYKCLLTSSNTSLWNRRGSVCIVGPERLSRSDYSSRYGDERLRPPETLSMGFMSPLQADKMN